MNPQKPFNIADWYTTIDTHDVEGKVLLSFNSIFTKRQAALEYKTAHVTESLHKKWFFLFLSLSVKFCTACRLSNHPSKFKCIFVFIRPWPPLLTSILMGMVLGDP